MKVRWWSALSAIALSGCLQTQEIARTDAGRDATLGDTRIIESGVCLDINAPCEAHAQCCSGNCVFYTRGTPRKCFPPAGPDAQCAALGQPCAANESCCTLRCSDGDGGPRICVDPDPSAASDTGAVDASEAFDF